MIARFTDFVKQFWHDIFVLGCIVLISVISYNLGRIRALEQTPLRVGEGANIYTAAGAPQAGSNLQAKAAQPAISRAPLDPRVVVSKSSTSKKYHYSWCSSGKQIKPENQIWYDTEAAAQQAGYTLAGNCQ
jgi:hypothetical protein